MTLVIGTRITGYFVGTGDFTVGELHFFQVREVGVRRILAVVHFVVDGDDDRVFQFGGVVVLLGTLSRSAVPLDNDFAHALAGSQGGLQQWRGFVVDLGDHNWLVNALTGWLAGLWITRDDHVVAESLNHDLVFVTFLISVANRIG